MFIRRKICIRCSRSSIAESCVRGGASRRFKEALYHYIRGFSLFLPPPPPLSFSLAFTLFLLSFSFPLKSQTSRQPPSWTNKSLYISAVFRFVVLVSLYVLFSFYRCITPLDRGDVFLISVDLWSDRFFRRLNLSNAHLNLGAHLSWTSGRETFFRMSYIPLLFVWMFLRHLSDTTSTSRTLLIISVSFLLLFRNLTNLFNLKISISRNRRSNLRGGYLVKRVTCDKM